MTKDNRIYQLKRGVGMIKLLMTFLIISLNLKTNRNIQDVTDSPADWEDFWYNEDV